MLQPKRCRFEEGDIGHFKQVTVKASPNIALIKYWGKENEDRMIPLNDSVSLNIDALYAETTVTAEKISNGNVEDTVEINEITVDGGKRFAAAFNMARESIGDDSWSFKVQSHTNFPVCAGLASSAAGFSAIAVAIGSLFQLTDHTVATIARYGSGSACRGVLSGLIRWKKGTKKDGEDCVIEQCFPSSHWPQLRAVILVVKDSEKETSSKDGMRQTAMTSMLMKERLKKNIEKIENLLSAFSSRDFAALGEIVMRESNEMHAVCLDTFPPLMYMNSTSWSIVNSINEFNKNGIRAAYTFDAGPNACIFTLDDDISSLICHLSKSFSFPSKATLLLSSSLGLELSTVENGPPLLNVILSTVGGAPSVVH